MLLSACDHAVSIKNFGSQTPPRVVFFVAADDLSEQRGYGDYLQFRSAVKRLSGTDDDSKVRFEFVQALDRPDPLAAAARKLVSERPAAIVATSYDALLALEPLTNSIPILFLSHPNPVRLGLVKSIAAPGVNRTGFTYYLPVFAKQIEVLRDAYPAIRRVGVVTDEFMIREGELESEVAGARTRLHLDIEVFKASGLADLQRVLRRPEVASIDAWFIPISDVISDGFGPVIRVLAATGKPVLFSRSAAAALGAPLSYQSTIDQPLDIWARQLRLILDGVDPATIPVEQPDSFEIAINVDAAVKNESLRPSKAIIRRATRFISGP